MRLAVFTLLFSLVVAFPTVIPTQAEAASALFTGKRTFYNDGVGFGNRTAYFPDTIMKAPPLTGRVGTMSTYPAPNFTVPQSAISDYTYYVGCVPGTCWSGYPVSVSYHSYKNLKGSFRPNNPYAPTAPVTVRFPTTMGTTGPPYGTGHPVTPTTTFSGHYDFSRAGSIMITPGTNRFGGTMQFFYGPNQRYYQRITVFYPLISRAYGGGQPNISGSHKSQVSEFVIGRQMDQYRFTVSGYSKYTTGSGAYYVQKVQYVSTIVPFTTGMITGMNPWVGTSSITITGYDNRTPNGLNGVISMVRPRLVHTYVLLSPPFPAVMKKRSKLNTWRITLNFLPEPGSTVMLAAGVVALVGLYRLRRR